MLIHVGMDISPSFVNEEFSGGTFEELLYGSLYASYLIASELIETMINSTKPIIAAVNGSAIGYPNIILRLIQESVQQH